MNVRDSEVICGLLQAEKWQLAASPDKADAVILNTCSVRQHAEDRVWSQIGSFKKLATKPIIGLVGCMAQNYKGEVFQRAPEVDFVVGPSDLARIPKIIDDLDKLRRTTHNAQRNTKHALLEKKVYEADSTTRPEDIYHTGFHQDKTHAYVVISEGCSNFCSYCVVPYVRGPLRHRDRRDILKEIEEAVGSGITRITLLGQNVNAYGAAAGAKKTDSNFLDLLISVDDIPGLKEFTFMTSHPKDASTELFRVMADRKKLKKHLHLPVQSGSDRILELMNRGYTRKFYLELCDNYRRIVGGGKLTSDIIVGFPTESEEDFEHTCDLARKACFNAAYIFKYSSRSHTKAASMPDDVALPEKERRHRLMLDSQKSISKK